MKAILIDVYHCEVRMIDIGAGKLEDIKAPLKVKWIEGVYPRILHGRDIMYVDEEGLLHGQTLFFKIAGYVQAIAGNGLICGSDDEGDTADCVTPIDLVKKAVDFLYLVRT